MTTILLVEDEVLISLATKSRLERNGYTMYTAGSGEEAIEVVKKEKLDLILMDIDLQHTMDGIETSKIILKDNKIPIVFLTSHIEKDIVDRLEDIKYYGFVTKASGVDVLNAAIKMALRLFEDSKDKI